MDENAELQEEELEVLKSIYDGDSNYTSQSNTRHQGLSIEDIYLFEMKLRFRFRALKNHFYFDHIVNNATYILAFFEILIHT